MRTLIDLPERAIQALAKLCARDKISRAEVIRRAVDFYLKQHTPDPEEDAFGLWRDRDGDDGREYEDRLRDELNGREGGL